MFTSRQLIYRFVIPLFVINLLFNGITTKGNKVKKNHTKTKEVTLRPTWTNGIFQERSSSYGAEARGYSSSHYGGGWHGGGNHYQSHDQNMDLYSLLGGLSFASLLGATIIFLARRNTTGRRRRAIDSIFDDEDDDLTSTIVLNSIEHTKFDTKYDD